MLTPNRVVVHMKLIYSCSPSWFLTLVISFIWEEEEKKKINEDWRKHILSCVLSTQALSACWKEYHQFYIGRKWTPTRAHRCSGLYRKVFCKAHTQSISDYNFKPYLLQRSVIITHALENPQDFGGCVTDLYSNIFIWCAKWEGLFSGKTIIWFY